MRTTRRQSLTALAALPGLLALAASAQGTSEPPAEVRAALPGARLQGQMRFRWLGLTVYDTRLWVAGEPISAQDYAGRSFALELLYARALDGARIADRSLDEMRRLDRVEDRQAGDWRAAMVAAFPDVVSGDRLTGLHQSGRGARFFHNARPTREVADTEFARLFFGIWLSPRSPEPALRQALLGGGAG
jgi:hypothetical protein